ncbi:hypothetical protein [Candidatus Magnetaquicoccus inordinatus]|uniref:hypothetical protein n=1 Tax=Candidatus Magnetaquicoccus inordinatus TaxID=2496818 RepID=UPI00102BA88D|nr:hypothetical protein [Candidatus Magnetaquicoccus inordinatus]
MSAHRIHQIQVLFSAEEDRLQLRINTHGRSEFRFWLTRRFIKRLWPGLRQAMETHVQLESTTPVDPHNRAALLSFVHQQAVSETDFATRYQEEPCEMPLGAVPVLVTRARIEPREQGGYLLGLHPQTSYGIEVAMDPKLLHSFCKLIIDAVGKADWDLSLALAPAGKVVTDVGTMYGPNGSNYTIN